MKEFLLSLSLPCSLSKTRSHAIGNPFSKPVKRAGHQLSPTLQWKLFLSRNREVCLKWCVGWALPLIKKNAKECHAHTECGRFPHVLVVTGQSCCISCARSHCELRMSPRQQASPAVRLTEGTANGKPLFSRRVEEETRNYSARFSSERKPIWLSRCSLCQ